MMKIHAIRNKTMILEAYGPFPSDQSKTSLVRCFSTIAGNSAPTLEIVNRCLFGANDTAVDLRCARTQCTDVDTGLAIFGVSFERAFDTSDQAFAFLEAQMERLGMMSNQDWVHIHGQPEY